MKRATQRSFNVVDLGAAPGGWSQVIAAKLGLAGEEPDEAITHRRPPKRASNMAEWKEEMGKRKKLSGIFDESVEDEIAEMEGLTQDKTTNDWSTPPSLKSKKFGLDRQSEEPISTTWILWTTLTHATSSSPRLHVGVHTVQMDFLSPNAPGAVISLLDKLNQTHAGKVPSPSHTRVDLMLSDLSPPHTGNRTADVSHSVTLLRAVWDFARKTLKTRKEYHLERVRQAQWIRQDIERQHGLSGTGQDAKEEDLKENLEKEVDEELVTAQTFRTSPLDLILPHLPEPILLQDPLLQTPASRTDSSEGYWVCIGWRGVPENVTMAALEEKLERDAEEEEIRQIEKKKGSLTARTDVELAMDSGVLGKAEKIIAGEALRPDDILELRNDETSAPSPSVSSTLSDEAIPSTTASDPIPSSSAKNDSTREGPSDAGSSSDGSQVVVDWRPKP
ncbi:FtsJ-like methyltransferase-domain-containing protein [Irpex lacteus]|nr:FtsJ-like methyltransferase-domain-containing protein [Irpex lacteus]